MNAQITATSRQSNGDFVPANAERFHQWVNSLVAYITPEKATAWNIPKAQMNSLKKLLNQFNELQQNISADPTRTQIERRNQAQKTLTGEVRYVIQRYLRRQSNVSDADLLAMGIPPIDHTRTPHFTVTATVAIEFRPSVPFTIVVDFWQAALSHSRARPKGFTGAVFLWNIGEEMPTNTEDYKHHELITRRLHRFSFDAEHRGKRVWFTACWQNARGIRGEWCPPVSTVIA